MYAENIYTEEIFSDDDLEKLKEFINKTVEKYGIAPIDNIEKIAYQIGKNNSLIKTNSSIIGKYGRRELSHENTIYMVRKLRQESRITAVPALK